MKIPRLNDNWSFLNRVQGAREEGQGRRQKSGEERHAQDPSHEDSSHERSKPEDEESFLHEVEAAVNSFEADPNTQSNGLHATAVSQGPGLRVVLKDASGVVLRQFTGEEFLQLREAASKDPRSRGKLLDRKF